MTDGKKPNDPEEKDAFKKQEDEAGSDSGDANAHEEVGDMVEQIETPGITGL